MLKLLTVWITINCGNFFKRWEYDHLTCLLRNLYAGQEATGHGTTDWFQIGKGYVKAVLSPAYLTSMQGTSCEMPGWMKHKLESRLLGEISITSDAQTMPPLRQKAKNKEPLGESERRE